MDPSGSNDVIQRMYASLVDSQFAPRATIEAHQHQTLRQLINHAIEQTAFYRRRLSHLPAGDVPIDPGAWASIEPVDRSDLASHQDDLIARTVPANHGPVRVKHSSGSSGAAIRALCTSMTDVADAAAVFRHYTARNVDWSRPLAQIRVFRSDVRRLESAARDTRSWAPPWLPETQRGEIHRHTVFAPIGEQLRWLADIPGNCYLNTLPSNLRRIIGHLRRENTRLESVLAVLSVGEPVTDELRQGCRTWLNAEIIDMYSSAECGVVATECSAGALHVQSEICLVEVLRPDGTPCRHGEAGDLVVTPFYNFAAPLIRYRTGDIATPVPDCACGQTLPVLDAAIARASHQVDLGGGRLWSPPAGFDDGLARHLGACPWQIVQEAGGRVELRYCRPRDPGPVDDHAAAAYLRSLLAPHLEVTCTEVDIIGRGPGGKFASVSRISN